jgi:(p)ppGpp synthase/HD superfamily hydrolase
MNLVDRALHLAIQYHNGHVNPYDNEPYMFHLHRVYLRVRDMGGSEIQQAAAWLHDAIEDRDLTVELLEANRDIPEQLVEALIALTHIKNEPYDQYCYRAWLNPDARMVKRMDLIDNFSRNHLIEDADRKKRLATKYSKGLAILNRV